MRHDTAQCGYIDAVNRVGGWGVQVEYGCEYISDDIPGFYKI